METRSKQRKAPAGESGPRTRSCGPGVPGGQLLRPIPRFWIECKRCELLIRNNSRRTHIPASHFSGPGRAGTLSAIRGIVPWGNSGSRVIQCLSLSAC